MPAQTERLSHAGARPQREPLAQERVIDEVLEHARVARGRHTRSCGSWRMARRSRNRLGLCEELVLGLCPLSNGSAWGKAGTRGGTA